MENSRHLIDLFQEDIYLIEDGEVEKTSLVNSDAPPITTSTTALEDEASENEAHTRPGAYCNVSQ